MLQIFVEKVAHILLINIATGAQQDVSLDPSSSSPIIIPAGAAFVAIAAFIDPDFNLWVLGVASPWEASWFMIKIPFGEAIRAPRVVIQLTPSNFYHNPFGAYGMVGKRFWSVGHVVNYEKCKIKKCYSQL